MKKELTEEEKEITKTVVDKLSGDDMNKELQLLTPTGRASKRLSEATGYLATTMTMSKEDIYNALNRIHKFCRLQRSRHPLPRSQCHP